MKHLRITLSCHVLLNCIYVSLFHFLLELPPFGKLCVIHTIFLSLPLTPRVYNSKFSSSYPSTCSCVCRSADVLNCCVEKFPHNFLSAYFTIQTLATGVYEHVRLPRKSYATHTTVEFYL